MSKRSFFVGSALVATTVFFALPAAAAPSDSDYCPAETKCKAQCNKPGETPSSIANCQKFCWELCKGPPMANPATSGGTLQPKSTPAVAKAKPTEVTVATYDRSTGRVGPIRRELLRATFDDGSPVKDVRVTRQGGKYFLELSGGKPNACRTDRVDLVPSGGGELRIRNNSAMNSCSGDPCSQCKFDNKPDGTTGCKCVDTTGKGKCNHTLSSGKAFSVLRAEAFRQ